MKPCVYRIVRYPDLRRAAHRFDALFRSQRSVSDIPLRVGKIHMHWSLGSDDNSWQQGNCLQAWTDYNWGLLMSLTLDDALLHGPRLYLDGEMIVGFPDLYLANPICVRGWKWCGGAWMHDFDAFERVQQMHLEAIKAVLPRDCAAIVFEYCYGVLFDVSFAARIESLNANVSTTCCIGDDEFASCSDCCGRAPE